MKHFDTSDEAYRAGYGVRLYDISNDRILIKYRENRYIFDRSTHPQVVQELEASEVEASLGGSKGVRIYPMTKVKELARRLASPTR